MAASGVGKKPYVHKNIEAIDSAKQKGMKRNQTNAFDT